MAEGGVQRSQPATQGGPLGSLMRGWVRQISPGYRNKASFMRKMLRQMQGTWLACVATLFQTIIAGVDLALAKDFKGMRVPFLVVVGGFSCFIGQLLLLYRRDSALECLRLLTSVCDAFEMCDDSTPSKVTLGREAAASRRRTRLLLTYCMVSLVGSLGTMATDESLFTYRWSVATGGPALRWTKAVFDVYATLASHVSNFTIMTMVQTAYHTAAVLFDQVGRFLQAKAGDDAVRRGAMLGGRLTLASRNMNNMFGRLLPHYLLVALLMPMVSTAEVLLSGGKADSFAVSTVPFILFEFMPFCLVGQQLEDASEDMSFWAYRGPWLDESLKVRRSRLMILTAATRPAHFGLQGLVRLNRETCLDALRVWFNYLQVLLNVSSH